MISSQGRTFGALVACAALAVTIAAVPAQAHGPNHPEAIARASAGLGPTKARAVFGPLRAASGLLPTTTATILSVSDFHGRLNPTTFRIDVRGERFGGAGYLQTYFKQRAALAPNPPFLVTQGDAVGATQPVSSLRRDRPTIDVMNRMGFDADTLGNHNFDDGVEHMAQLAELADFPYLVTNLVDGGGERPPWTQRSTVWEVDGVQIGVTGAINDDAKDLLRPGAMADLEITPAAAALNAEAARLRADGIGTVVALVHFGADTGKAGPDGAAGPLIDLAKQLRGVDVLLGDHTYWQVNQPVRGADGRPVWVVQSIPNGVSFSEIKLAIGRGDGEPVSVVVDQFLATTRGVTPDPEIQAVVDAYNAEVKDEVDEAIGTSTRSIPENVAVAEANQGNVVADALRKATGAQMALLNSGGLRAALTDDNDRDADGNYLIRRGAVFGMLPFNDQMTTVEVTGAELKRMLENGVSQAPAPAARFPQVSGFSFGYTLASRDRVRWARLDDGTPISFDAESRYTLAMTDFVANGSDGYIPFGRRITYRGDLEDAVIAYVEANPRLVPPGPPHEQPKRIVIE